MPVILGRQEDQSEPLGELTQRGDHFRLPFAPFPDVHVSRRQLKLARSDNGGVLLEVLKTSADTSMALTQVGWHSSGAPLDLPVTFRLGAYSIQIEAAPQTLAERTRLHTRMTPSRRSSLFNALGLMKPAEAQDFIAFMNQMASVLQLSADEEQLCAQACEAVTKLIEVDGAAVYRATDWSPVGGSSDMTPHRSALERVKADKHVLWKSASTGSANETANTLDCYVAAPILASSEGEEDEIYGVLYAHRNRHFARAPGALTELHARLVELVACTLGAGLLRSRQEKQSHRFEQFFPPELVKKLVRDDQLLLAQQREVSILFCDIRGFSAVSERVGPDLTSEWVQDLLSSLSQCVLDHQGVLVDFVGDELMAMWGAPEDQPDHADLACKAALAMLDELVELDSRWLPRIGSATRVGIGINSGIATVGNSGSRQRFKYGPLGDTVNRASRVQGLTKHLRVPILITESTRSRLTDPIGCRRIGKAKAVNMDEPIELYELQGEGSNKSTTVEVFNLAIGKLEAGDLEAAAELLLPAIDLQQIDYPSMLVLNAIVGRLLGEGSEEGHVWDFGSK